MFKKLELKRKQVTLSKLNPWETFKIGEHDFKVLKRYREKSAVVSDDFLIKNVKFDDTSINYAESNLKKVIETQVQPIIESEVGADNIVPHYVDLTTVDMQDEFGTCVCKVRPITFNEAREYNLFLVNYPLDMDCWTCTPISSVARGNKNQLEVLHPSGRIGSCDCNKPNGVRVFCLLKSTTLVTIEEWPYKVSGMIDIDEDGDLIEIPLE